MNREIKFRAWDERSKRFYTDTSIAVSPDGVLRHFRVDDSWIDTSFIPMQYTGLKDKNGKEIYEGDIVKLKFLEEYNGNFSIDEGGEIIGEIVFERASFIVGLDNDWLLLLDVIEEQIEIEIIGNIYENSELLKEEDES